MGTQLKGQNNTAIVSRKKEKREAPQEFIGNVPVGDEWNVRGWPATGTECGSTMAGTRPDSSQNLDRMAA